MKNIYTKYFLLSVLSIVFLCTKNYPQETKLIKRVMTESEFTKFKNSVGTYQEGKNYNQIINGHGTGLMPPTEEQWKEIRTQPMLIDRIEYPLKKAEVLSSHDNSATIWFPPIGNQGSEGSCVSWACVYYTKTFQEAKEHNWDLSGCLWEGGSSGYPSASYQDKIFSPDFVYHQVNYGGDNGSGYGNNMGVLEQIGCCTWDKMPNDPYDHTSWPSEDAWRQAPWYRSQTGYGYMPVDTDSGIEDLKLLLVNGNLAVISVNPSYLHFGARDLWTLGNYPGGGGHVNTVVGYDDNFGPFTESGNSNVYGAFKVANSWGVGSWEKTADGFYYISYECMKQRIKQIYLYQNYLNYIPQMVAVFEMNNCFRHDNVITFSLGDPYSPNISKCPFSISVTGGNFPYPDYPTVVDITEFIPYMSESSNQFSLTVHKQYGSSIGVLQYFSVEIYDDYTTEIPEKVYVSTETPIYTQQDIAKYASIFASPEMILITYPAGGEELQIGSSPIITYSSVGTSGYINLDYSTDRGTTWNNIATNVVNNGVYADWIVPSIQSAYCKIRISDADGTPSVISKGLFRIGPDEFTEQTSISLIGVQYSSVAWGDYDNDGDLDILLTGESSSGYISKIYRNNGDNSFTEQTSISLIGVSYGSAAWGDYDNDGNLDILITGYGNHATSKIYRNYGNSTFTEQTLISLTGVGFSSIDWGDYDNDGDLDILLTGDGTDDNSISKILGNNYPENTFTDQTSITLTGASGASRGSVVWGDYDNDGDLDILLIGNGISKIYRNNGDNSFEEQTSISLIGVFGSSSKWGDYDNDGDLDILLTGGSSFDRFSKIYRNNGDNTFEEQTSIWLTGVNLGSAAWGDYDNDGDLDILLTGSTELGIFVSKIYRNNGNNTFSDQTSISLAAVWEGSVAWGDYDNDGDLDILLTGTSIGGPVSKIYRNNNLIQNTPPNAPTNLQALVNGNDITFIWDKSTDGETPQNGLKYNLVIGTSPNAINILSPMSDRNTGYRRVVNLGNTNHDTSWTIKGLADGQYFWSVQAIDNNFAGSAFAPTQSFKIGDEFEQFTEQTSVSLTGVAYSSAAWGDYDNDGDLDVLLTGGNISGTYSKIYRNNGNSAFSEQTLISLAAVWEGSVAWGDYDNDDDLDILLTGSGDIDYMSKIYRNDGNNSFSETSIPLRGVCLSSVAWGDYDNDGDLDILLTGMTSNVGRISKVYCNNGDNTFTEQTSIVLTSVERGSVAWGDYDNDGDLDILLTGNNSSEVPVSKIYRNNGNNSFAEQTSIELIGVFHSSVAWGDYDNDGDLDIFLTGNISWDTPISKIYRNNGNNTFIEQTSIDLVAVSHSSVAWGDYDNDGDLDILLTGLSLEGDPISKVYRNNGDNTFTEQTSIDLTGVSYSSIAWGDYDNDGDLDILLTGSNGQNEISKIYRNNNPIQNTPPNAPTNLQAVVNGNEVTFSWNKSTDNETPQDGLHYNLVIGTTSKGVDKLSPMSNSSTGFRRVVRLGNSQTYSWTIKDLPKGQYYWSVQSIDNSFTGSQFATEQFIDVPVPVELTSFNAAVKNTDVILIWETATEVNSYGFEVERTSSFNEWQKIGFVQASGNSSSLKQYNFTDRKLNSNKYSYRLKKIDVDGTFEYSDIVEAEIQRPKDYSLSQNYPNAFNPTTKIDYQLPLDSKVTIELYSIAGEKVATIISKELTAGYYTAEINASALNLSSGVYIYRMSAISQGADAQAFIQVKKLMLMK